MRGLWWSMMGMAFLEMRRIRLLKREHGMYGMRVVVERVEG
jgi:hypothetical protein